MAFNRTAVHFNCPYCNALYHVVNGRSKRWTPSRPSRPEPQRSQNARRNYEQYLTLAQAEAQNGNTVAAENYYQYAEHYFRSMTSDSEEAKAGGQQA